ncbi:MAG TPA: class I SAM-dependent methyltransferase [Candidatus Acidoferrales bacterium]
MDRPRDSTEYSFTAEFYDHIVPYRNRPDIAFFVEKAQQAGDTVLELGCGTGRVLIPIARAGIKIVGLDLSPFMLSACREKLAREPAEVQAKVRLVEGDMRNFDLGRQFSLVTIPFRSFQHLITVEDQLSCLACIHRHLVEGGTFILDLFNPYLPRLVEEQYLTETEEEPEFTMPDGRRVVRRHRTVARDLFRQVQEIELIYYVTHPGGRQERLVDRFSMRYLFRFETEHLLARCALRVVEVYTDYDKSPYGSKHPGELIFVAKK